MGRLVAGLEAPSPDACRRGTERLADSFRSTCVRGLLAVGRLPARRCENPHGHLGGDHCAQSVLAAPAYLGGSQERPQQRDTRWASVLAMVAKASMKGLTAWKARAQLGETSCAMHGTYTIPSFQRRWVRRWNARLREDAARSHLLAAAFGTGAFS